jgi:cellobiose-specific phosphotransferase system component IIA
MKPIATAYMVLPGKTEKAKTFMKSLRTNHAKDFAALEKKLKTTKEAIFLEHTPQGDIIIDYFESSNPQKSIEIMAKLNDKFTAWMKDQIKDITGFDVNTMAHEPLPEQLLKFGY